MEESTKAPANKSGKADPFLITDADMAFLNPRFSFYSVDFDNKFRKSIFHKYFLKSIEKVKEDKSRHVLLIKLQQQLDTGIYHFPITDIDPLYECIFETLPKLELFRTNSTFMEELFLIMNIFMLRFYDAAYPFFYDFTEEGNIFTYGPIFVINYFQQFSKRFGKNSTASERPYTNLLEHDGSLTNVLNYFFDQYTKGVELPLLSDCIYNLMKWLNCHFLRDYLTQKNFFKTGTSIFVNSNIKVSIRMDFLIAFYNNYFENNYEKVSTPFLKVSHNHERFSYEEEISKKAVMAQEILDDINDLKIKNYLETYLSSYVDQLIIEGRLLNTINPLGSKKDNLLNNSSMTFYPPKAEDEYIFHIFDLLVFMFRFIGQDELQNELYTNYHNCIFDFIPIISTIFKVIPGIFLSDWNKWTMILFDISRETNSNAFEILKNTFLEIIQMRISGDFLYNLNCREMINMLNIQYDELSGQKEIIKDINQTAISSYVVILLSRPNCEKEPFIDEDLFLSTIKFSSLDSTIEWFNTIIDKMKVFQMKNIISKATIKYLGNSSTEPKFIECVLDLFHHANFDYDDYEDLNEKGIIPYFFKLFIETPDLQKSILPSKIYAFCDSIGRYINDNDLLNEEALNTVIKTNNIFGIKLFSIVLKYGSKENYQLFVKRIIDDVISKSMKITPETIDEQIIKQIILISPFITTIKFNENDTMFNILKSSLDYLNNLDQIQYDLIEEYQDDSQLKFDPLLQSKVNIIYALTNSLGFTAVDDFLGLINYLLKGDYGMCIEVLNVISNIIGFLVDHLGDENITSKISATNETIFKITNILISNTPKNSINFNNQQSGNEGSFNEEEEEEKRPRFKRSFGISKQKHSNQKSILKFALYPLGYDKKTSNKNQRHNYNYDDDEEEEQNQIIYSCLYSFRMGGEKVDDTFGYSLKYKQKNKHDFEHQSIFTVNLFIRNITNYVINMLKILGIKPETINLFKQIIMISIKNGLIQVPTLETFLNFVTANPDFFTNEEETKNWISGLVERSSFLMSSSRSEKSESIKLEIGNKKDQLKLIFRFFYNMNQKIFPGCLTDELINLMFKYSSFSQESFLEFINSEEAEVDTKLNEFFDN